MKSERKAPTLPATGAVRRTGAPASGPARSGKATLAGPKAGDPRNRQLGSVLVIVLWVCFGLVSITLYFANSMSFELRASDNRVSAIATEQAIDGAARYVLSVLANLPEKGSMPDPAQFPVEAVAVGDAHYWFIGRDTNDPPVRPDAISCGLVDEASKLNLNRSSRAMLEMLPGITLDVAANIISWRTNTAAAADGVGSETYERLSPGYVSKSSYFDTVDELRLVYGVDMEMLIGEDLNMNGILDPNEVDANHNGRVDPGLLDCVTVYSREPNKRTDGTTALVNINDARQQLMEMIRTNVEAGRVGQITQAIAQVQTFNSPLHLYAASGMTLQEFEGIADDITTVGGDYVDGRININTASVAVLSCLPGLTNRAQEIVSFRTSNPDKLRSVGWLLEALGLSGNAATQFVAAYPGLARRLTTKSYQFTADIAALGPYGRGYRRVRFVFDTSTGTPKIIYRQDLTNLGWALGKGVRETWLAKKES